jgi:uncharacterized membrane protein YhaH (DUF805 family)
MFDVINGRTGRARFWGLTSICILAFIAGLYAVVVTANQTSSGPVNVPATIMAVAGVFILVTACVALFFVGIWRLHDRGKSGFWIILYYAVPAILAMLAIDSEGQGTLPEYVALAILVWVIIDLGVFEGAERVAA